MQTPALSVAFYRWMRFLFPRLQPQQAAWMLLFGVVGAFIAGLYGVVHDQVTFTLGPEYFTRYKVWQFDYAEEPGPLRWVVAKIGFQASWAVGLFAGWFLGRVSVPQTTLRRAAQLSLRGVSIMLVITLLGGLGGGLWARIRLTEDRLSHWSEAFRWMEVTDMTAFATVGFIHNGSYLGALVGLIAALWWVRRRL